MNNLHNKILKKYLPYIPYTTISNLHLIKGVGLLYIILYSFCCCFFVFFAFSALFMPYDIKLYVVHTCLLLFVKLCKKKNLKNCYRDVSGRIQILQETKAASEPFKC